MILEFVIETLIVLLICLEIFAISQVVRILERRRSTVMPGFIRDFDDTPSQKRRLFDIDTIQYLIIASGLGGALVTGVSFMVSSYLFPLVFTTGIIFLVFGTICKVLIQRNSTRNENSYCN